MNVKKCVEKENQRQTGDRLMINRGDLILYGQ